MIHIYTPCYINVIHVNPTLLIIHGKTCTMGGQAFN